MTKAIKEHLDIILALLIGLALAMAGIMGLSNTIPLADPASAATETISVSATIEESVTFSVSTSSVVLLPVLVEVGGGTNIASSGDITITAGTNDAGGYSIDIRDSATNDGGLCHSGGCGVHKISSASTTLSAGTDGYGVQATTSDADVTVDSDFDHWGNEQVGGINNNPYNFASTSGPSSNDQITMKIKAAANANDESGTYSDTITLTCLGST